MGGAPKERPAVFCLVGFTASGKKKVGVSLAGLLDAEIISLDSMKVYRGMDIGTAKPSAADRQRAVFHMLDLAAPSDSFSAGRYLAAAKTCVAEIHARGRRALFLGGTPFYLNCLVKGLFTAGPVDPAIREGLLNEARERGPQYLHGRLRGADPASAEGIHPNDVKRLVRALEVMQATGRPLSWLKEHRTVRIVDNPVVLAGLRRDGSVMEAAIRERTDKMIAKGLVEEVGRILASGGFGPEAGKAIGYAEIAAHLRGELSLAEAREAIVRNTLRFVKKQATWYRRFAGIRWFTIERAEEVEPIAADIARYFTDSAGA